MKRQRGDLHVFSGRPDSPLWALAHRVPRLVWACGEHFGQERLSIASELMRHGLREWAGIKECIAVPGVDGEGRCSAEALLEIRAGAASRTEVADFPIVLCRDAAVVPVLIGSAEKHAGTVLALMGHPAVHRTPPLFAWQPPVPLPEGLTPERIAWFGAPASEYAGGSQRLRPRLLSGIAALVRRDAPGVLQSIESLLREHHATHLCVVLFADCMRLGRSGEFIDDAFVAGLLNWLQRQEAEPLLVVVSGARITPSLRWPVAEAARHLGQALFRHGQAPAGKPRAAVAPSLHPIATT